MVVSVCNLLESNRSFRRACACSKKYVRPHGNEVGRARIRRVYTRHARCAVIMFKLMRIAHIYCTIFVVALTSIACVCFCSTRRQVMTF